MLRYNPDPSPEIHEHAYSIVNLKYIGQEQEQKQEQLQYLDMTLPLNAISLESPEIVDAVLLIAVHGQVTCMLPSETRQVAVEDRPTVENGPKRILRMSMSSVGDVAYMNDLYTNHIVLYIHSFLQSIITLQEAENAKKMQYFCALSIVCSRLAIFYNLPFKSSNIFQISDITRVAFDKEYGLCNDTGKCNDFNIVLHYINSSHKSSHKREPVYFNHNGPIAHSTLMQRKFSNIRNLYIIDLSCNVLDSAFVGDDPTAFELDQQLNHCSFQIQYQSPSLIRSVVQPLLFTPVVLFHSIFKKHSKHLLDVKKTTDAEHYIIETTKHISNIHEDVDFIISTLEKFEDKSCISHPKYIEQLDNLHQKLNDIIIFSEMKLNDVNNDENITLIIEKAKHVKTEVIEKINNYQKKWCRNGVDFFVDLHEELSRLNTVYEKLNLKFSTVEIKDNDEERKEKIITQVIRLHNDLKENLEYLEERGKLRLERLKYLSGENISELYKHWNETLAPKISAFIHERVQTNKEAQIKRITAGLQAILPQESRKRKEPNQQNQQNQQRRLQGGKKLENTLKLSRYIKERQVAFHPTLRIRRAALEEINGNIVEYALHKVVKGRLSSTSAIQSKMRKLLVENVMEGIEKKYEKLMIQTEKTEEKLLNKEEQYVHKKINSYLRKMKIELLGKDRKKSIVLLTVMVGKLVDVACKRAGSDLKKRNRNNNKKINTIEISNVENIKSEIMSVKRQKKIAFK